MGTRGEASIGAAGVGGPSSAAGAQHPARVARREPVWSAAFVGLCVFTFAIVTYRFPVGELGIAIAVIGLAIQRPALRAPAPFWILVGYTVWASLSAWASPFPASESQDLWERLKLVAVFFIALNVLRTSRQVYVYVGLLLLCFILFPVRGALVNYIGGYTIFGRALWNYVYSNPNDLAALCLVAMGLTLSLATARATSGSIRLGAVAAGGMLVAVVLLTQSRGGFIGLVAGFGLGAVSFLRTRRGGVLVGLVLVAVVSVALPGAVWERLSGISKLTSSDTIAQADQEGSAEQRWQIQKTAVRIFSDNWLLGVGPGAYKAANALYAPEIGFKDTHNTYLNVAAETGLPGLLLWIALVMSVLIRAVRSTRNEAAVDDPRQSVQFVWITRGLIAFLIAGLFGSYASITMPYIILALLWCCADLSTPKLRASRLAVV
jgi:O-antigen ligase